MTPAALSLARRVRDLLSEPDFMGGDPLALYWLAAGDVFPIDAAWVHRELLAALQDAVNDSLVKWLRAPGRTHADVLALLGRVIADGER